MTRCRRWRRLPQTLLLAVSALLVLAALAQATPTVVTLGFDEGLASQYAHRSILQSHGAHATFFITSGKMGNAGAMTWAQAGDLAAGGNEIGGNTIDHANLTTLTQDQMVHEVCDDRTAIQAHGLNPTNFAYPSGGWNATAKTVAQGCGYDTARTTGGTDFPDPCCVFAETMPPKSAYTLRAYQPRLTTPLSTYQDLINRVRLAGGGWVNLVLHSICDDPCTGADSFSESATTIDQLLTWINQQPDVEIRTTAQVLALPTDLGPPSVSLTGPADGSSVTGTTTLTANASDDQGVSMVELLVDGTVVGSDTSAPYSVDWNTASAGDTATIAARATDKAGNVVTSSSRTVTVVHPDAVPPTATLTAPGDGASVLDTDTVALTADASDNIGVDHVDFLVNGAVVGTDATAPYGVSWNPTAAGSATITARAVDLAGNATTSTAHTVTVKHASPTVVTLGFDDGLASQYDHRSILQAHNAPVTYFINSGNVGKAGYFTWAQIADLAGAGNEIAGHTLDHPDLTTLSSADQQREVCDDRNALLAHGYEARNFAYPFGAWNAGVESVVSGCGYSTARTTGGTDYPEGPVYAETVPPKSALTLRAIQTRVTTTLDTYKDIVEKARFSGGGWVNIVLHDICDDPCSDSNVYAISGTTLDQFLTWLGQQPGVSIKTEAQALHQAPDTTAPTVSLTAPADGSTVQGTTTLTATASDDVGVTRVDFLVDGTVVGSDSTAPYSCDWDSSTAGSSATITARAVDPAGNATTSAPGTVTVNHPDLTGPTLALTAPADGATVHGTVTLTADASDPSGVDHVDFLVDGSVVGTDASAPFAYDWDSSTAGGSATITARAVDTVGNASTSAPHALTIQHASPTVVTLGFDDGLASQYAHRAILQAHNVPATFFINTGNVGQAGYVTWAQIADLAAAGNEIAGHTLDHPDLTTLSTADQQREVCDDRNALLAHGYEARNFAYPFGAWNAGVESVVSGCGYSTARTTGGTDYPEGPEYAETLPPKNPLTLRAIEPRLTTTLATYEDIVEKARFSGGGWVNLVQHDVCDDPCNGADDYAMSATTLDQLLTWLAQQPGVTVKTEAQALGQAPDTTAPTVSLTAPAAGSTVSGTTTITANANDNVAVARVDFYVNGAVLGSDATAPYSFAWSSSTFPASSTIAAHAIDTSGNERISAARTVTVADVLAPSPTITAPATGASVSGTVALQGTANDNRGVTRVDFLVEGTVIGSDSSAPYSVNWNSSSSQGKTVTITMRARDAAGNTTTTPGRSVFVLDTTAPTVSLTAPTSGASVRGNVTISASASDNVGVTLVDFLVNGVVVGSDATAPFAVVWGSATAGSSATLTARAHDAAGNVKTSAARTVTVLH